MVGTRSSRTAKYSRKLSNRARIFNTFVSSNSIEILGNRNRDLLQELNYVLAGYETSGDPEIDLALRTALSSALLLR